MPSDVIMPALGMAQETGKVVRWLKRDGEGVTKGEPLLEIETDKVTVEIESPAAGTLAAVTAPDGAEVPVGTVIAVVLAPGEIVEISTPPASPPAAAVRVVDGGSAAPPVQSESARGRPRRRLASPKARRLAEARGIDLDTLAGSGPNGAVTAKDIESLAAAAPGALETNGDAFQVGFGHGNLPTEAGVLANVG